MAARSDYRSGATLVHLVYFCWNPRVIGILCDGDDRRIFLEFESFDSVFFVCVGKNLASIFIGGLIKEGIFRGITDIGCIVLGIKHNQRKCSWVSD